MDKIIKPKTSISGKIKVPGDKSISHRAVMFGSIAEGITEIDGFLTGADCLATIDCFRRLGIEIEQSEERVKIYGKGLYGLSKPSDILYTGNSGTTIRLMSGILCGQNFSSSITGDESIQKRPMDRVINPLKEMNSDIVGKDGGGLAPLSINGRRLKGIDYTMPVASAQVKSAILLASLYADSPTAITEKEITRNHSEIMLEAFGADIKTKGNKIISSPVKQLYAKNISIPADISSAAFFIVAALILPHSHIIIENVGINETRTGIITALLEMGADIKFLNKRESSGEEVSDIEVKSSKLRGIIVQGEIIPKMIDEIPIFAIATLFAEGTTIIKDASELKVKESNRINAMVSELKKMGADISETVDGMIINGQKKLSAAIVESHHDHRIAMSLAIAALTADGETEIKDAECVDISFPNFYEYLHQFN